MTLKFRHIVLLLSSCIVFAAPADTPAPSNKPDDATATPSASAPAAGATVSSASETKAAAPVDFTQSLVIEALGLIGVTYRWGGNSPETGLDCSGFIRYVFQQALNIALPHNAFAISRLGEDVDRDALKPGDLVFFNTLGRKFSHVGIYLGDDRFIHSPSRGSKIQVVSMKEAYWQKHYNGAKRVNQDTVSERSPKLAQLMSEERATEHEPRGKHGKHGKHAGKGGHKKSGHGHKKKKHAS
jgi:cell wall-associated NlpC family hydrolase